MWLYEDLAQLRPLEERADEYGPAVGVTGSKWAVRVCSYCGDSLSQLATHRSSRRDILKTSLWACQCCGWWLILGEEGYGGRVTNLHYYWSRSALKNLALLDDEMPTDELARYLTAKYDSHRHVDPRRFEDIVGGILQEFGLTVVVTSYSGDRGIDVIACLNEDDDLLGIQVKRYKSKIEASLIREFAGAMLLNGITRGVFVTTGGFRSGAYLTASDYTRLGYPIELWDGKRFLEMIQISRSPAYSGAVVSGPFESLWNKVIAADGRLSIIEGSALVGHYRSGPFS